MKRLIFVLISASVLMAVGAMVSGEPGPSPEELACQAYEMCVFDCDSANFDDFACGDDWDLPDCDGDNYDTWLRSECLLSCDMIPGTSTC